MTRSMQAVIMAGGEGSRLRPLTSNLPKPMLPIANRPMMEHIVELLKKHGFTDVVATVQFLSSVIRNYFADGSDVGVALSYATEEVPMGTAGSVAQARDLLSGRFLVISGDALTDIDLDEAIEFHERRGAAATLVLKRMTDPLDFGIVMTDDEGRVERFLEKPTWGQVFSDTINTGIYVLEPEVLDLIPPDQPYDFSSELFPAMLDKGLPVFGYVTEAYWADVGTSNAYLQAQRDVLARRVKVDLLGFEVRPGVWVGADADLHPSARVEGPTLIGDNVKVGAGAVVGPYAIVGHNALVDDDAQIVGGVVMDRGHVGAYARVRGGVLGRSASLGKGATLEEGGVMGDEVTVGAGALIKPNVKIYPGRAVEAGAIVTESVVRERRAVRSLFGSRGVSGLLNIGITPQVAVRLGMAYGSTLKRGSVVVTGRDASRSARTMKRALIAGLNSTGIHCHDLELMPSSIVRYTVRAELASGGVSVRTSPDDPEVVEIRLFGSDGADLPAGDQRKIERIFFREDYRRAGPTKLGELEFPPRTLEQYTTGLLGAVELDAVRAWGLKVVVDYAYGPLSVIGPSILGRFGCDFLSVHAFTDENRPVLVANDLERLLGELREHVRKSGSDLGVLLEPGGEVAHLVDDRGRLVSPQQALFAFLQHEAGRGSRSLAVPVSASSECERLVAAAGASLVRTPTGLPALMEAASRDDVGFAGNADGSLIWPSLMPAPDALMTFCKALELVAGKKTSLAEIVDELPTAHVIQRDVQTPWALKGTVMRELASADVPGERVLLDGVKVVNEGGWALVIPLQDAPTCRVWAESADPDEAERLADHFADLVQAVVDRGAA